MKYMVTGMGGIGGYIAAVLLNRFPREVTLVARGARKRALEKQGLIMHSARMGERTFSDLHVIDDPAQGGVQDMIFVSVKNFSLVEAVEALKPCVDDHTIVVPVLNGIDHAQVTADTLQQGYVVDSLIYMGAHYNEDYSYCQNTAYGRLFIGSPWPDKNELVKAALGGGPELDFIISPDMKSDAWKKYVSNCGYNTITAYYGCNGRGIFEHPERMAELRSLFEEALAVGQADGAVFPDGHIDNLTAMLFSPENLDGSSSLAADTIAGRQSELETFGGHLTRLAKKLGVAVPVSERFYREMKARGI